MTNPIHHVCPVCFRSLKLRVLKDGTRLLPGHGHRIMRGMHTGGMQCPTSGFSVGGLEIVRVWTSAFGLLKGRTAQQVVEASGHDCEGSFRTEVTVAAGLTGAALQVAVLAQLDESTEASTLQVQVLA